MYIKTFEGFIGKDNISIKKYGKDKYRIYYLDEIIGYIQYLCFKDGIYTITFATIKPEFRNKGYVVIAYKLFKSETNAKTIIADAYSKQSLKSIIKAYGMPSIINDEKVDNPEETIKNLLDELEDVLSQNYIDDYYVSLEWEF